MCVRISIKHSKLKWQLNLTCTVCSNRCHQNKVFPNGLQIWIHVDLKLVFINENTKGKLLKGCKDYINKRLNNLYLTSKNTVFSPTVWMNCAVLLFCRTGLAATSNMSGSVITLWRAMPTSSRCSRAMSWRYGWGGGGLGQSRAEVLYSVWETEERRHEHQKHSWSRRVCWMMFEDKCYKKNRSLWLEVSGTLEVN